METGNFQSRPRPLELPFLLCLVVWGDFAEESNVDTHTHTHIFSFAALPRQSSKSRAKIVRLLHPRRQLTIHSKYLIVEDPQTRCSTTTKYLTEAERTFSHVGQIMIRPKNVFSWFTGPDRDPDHLAPVFMFAPYGAGCRAPQVRQRLRFGFTDSAVTCSVFLDHQIRGSYLIS